MSNVLLSETIANAEQTTSMAWVDSAGLVREVSGELSTGSDSEALPVNGDELLMRFAAGISNCASGAVANVLDKWAIASSGPLEVVMEDGSKRLLTNYAHPEGGTVFLSIFLPGVDRRQNICQFVVDNISVPIWVNDLDGQIVYSNKAAQEFNENTPGTDENGALAELSVSRRNSQHLLNELETTRRLDNQVMRSVSRDGEEIWNIGNSTLADLNGEPMVISAVQDITGRKQVEEQTQRAREMLGDAIESLSEGFALYDEEGKLVLFNDKYREMNSAVEDILAPGLRWEMLMRTLARRGVYADAIGSEEQWVSDRLSGGGEYIQEYELKQTDGSTYSVSVHPTKLGGFVVTRTDITATKQAEATERESDLLVRKVLDTCSAVVVMARIGDGQVLYRSPAAQELFGQHDSATNHYVSANDRADYVTEMLVDGRVDGYRLDLINSEGKRFPARMSGRIADYRGEEVLVSHVNDLTEQVATEAMIRKVLEACPVPVQMTNAETGKLLFRSPETIALFGDVAKASDYYANGEDRVEYLELLSRTGSVDNRKMEFIDAKGRKFWGAVSARMIDFNGEKVVVSNTRDLTGEIAVQEELASQREMLFQNEKMSALGELLAGVAHELNNPLSVVVGHALMLREEVTDSETVKRIEKISSSAERCAKIVKTFLAMARQRPAKMEALDVGSMISTAAEVAGFGVGGNVIDIRMNVEDDMPEILADPDQITQVVINLIINAEQAMAKAGEGDWIEISAAMNKQRNALEIAVSDNGPGVPKKLRPRIFEPFFTTKDVGEGTGIGLAFCHRILHSHSGNIWLDSDYDEGSKFVLSLPARKSVSTTGEKTNKLESKSKAACVLVVDDEVDVADLIAEILRKDGCQVKHAVTGAAAMKLLQENEFDVVLSDLNMPEMDGRELFESIRSQYPQLMDSIAFVTGDAMGPSSQKLLAEAGCQFLEKPISPAELRDLVQGMLSSRKEKN
ncbi:MAG: ATP-binding protein, partial [Rhizobiaceae bacterium]